MISNTKQFYVHKICIKYLHMHFKWENEFNMIYQLNQLRLTITVTLTWINPNTSTANWIHKTAQIVHGILGAEFITLEDCKNCICVFQSGVSKKIWKHCRRSTDGLALGDRQRDANTCNTIERKVAFVFKIQYTLKIPC